MWTRKLFLIVSAFILSCAAPQYKSVENGKKDFSKLGESEVDSSYATARVSVRAAESVIAEVLGEPAPVQEINWNDFSVSGVTTAIDSGAYALVYFYSEGCTLCELTEQNIFSNPGVVDRLNNHFYAARGKAIDHPEMSIIFTDRESGNIISPSFAFVLPTGEALIVQGYISLQKFEYILDAIRGETPWISAEL